MGKKDVFTEKNFVFSTNLGGDRIKSQNGQKKSVTPNPAQEKIIVEELQQVFFSQSINISVLLTSLTGLSRIG